MHNREAATSRDPTSLGDIRVPQHETPAGHLGIHIRSDAPRAINRKLPTGAARGPKPRAGGATGNSPTRDRLGHGRPGAGRWGARPKRSVPPGCGIQRSFQTGSRALHASRSEASVNQSFFFFSFFFFFRIFLPLQVKEGPGPSAHCSLRGKSRFTHGQGGGWAQEPPASERLPGARAELAAGQQQQAPTGGVAQGKWQRAHAAPQRR